MKAASKTMPVIGTMCSREPYLEPMAFALLEDIRAYFQNPAHEAEFQEWKKDPEKVRQAWKEEQAIRETEERPCA